MQRVNGGAFVEVRQLCENPFGCGRRELVFLLAAMGAELAPCSSELLPVWQRNFFGNKPLNLFPFSFLFLYYIYRATDACFRFPTW